VNVRAIGDKAAVSLWEKFGPRVEEFFIDNGHRRCAAVAVPVDSGGLTTSLRP
jgi:hypothetical protein